VNACTDWGEGWEEGPGATGDRRSLRPHQKLVDGHGRVDGDLATSQHLQLLLPDDAWTGLGDELRELLNALHKTVSGQGGGGGGRGANETRVVGPRVRGKHRGPLVNSTVPSGLMATSRQGTAALRSHNNWSQVAALAVGRDWEADDPLRAVSHDA
jgi:hypothetical protein